MRKPASPAIFSELKSMKLTDNVWQVGGDGMSASGDGAVYLIVFGSQAALVDGGCGHGHAKIAANIRNIISLAVPIKYLFLTHCHYDHSGGAERLRSEFRCSIVAHEKDAPFLEKGDSDVTAASWYGSKAIPFRIDHKIKGPSEDFAIGSGTVTALHAPGHSPGSIVLVTQSAGQKVLFGQDVHGPLHPALLSREDEYQASLAMLAGLDADMLCEGHLGVYRGKDRVRQFIESYMNT